MLKIKEIREQKNMTQDEVSELSGIPKRSFINYETRVTDVPFLKLQKIATALNVDLQDLFDEQNQVSEPPISYSDKKKFIPLIPVEAIAGFGGSDVCILEKDIQDQYFIPEFQHVDYMIRVKGSSMYPKYSSGDIIACKFITDRSFFQWGRVYVLHHLDQGTIIKRIFPSETENNITCRSDNPSYPDFDVPTNDLKSISLVIGVIRLE